MAPTQELVDAQFADLIRAASSADKGAKIMAGVELYSLGCALRAGAAKGDGRVHRSFASVLDALHRAGGTQVLSGWFAGFLIAHLEIHLHAEFVVDWRDGEFDRVAEILGPGYRVQERTLNEQGATTPYRVVTDPDSLWVFHLLPLSEDAHDQAQFARRQTRPLFGRPVAATTAEDVIVAGLRSSLSEQFSMAPDHIGRIIAASGDPLDWDYIYRWCDIHGTRPLLDDIRRSIPAV